MNRKGFTLVELLGVIIILSIIMLIAIPNVTSILERSKKDSYISDAKIFVSEVETEIRKGSVLKPGTGETQKVTLQELATSDIEKDQDGNAYDLNKSFVIIERNSDGYLVYYVQLVAQSKGSYTGISLTNKENLDGENKYNYYQKGMISVPDNL